MKVNDSKAETFKMDNGMYILTGKGKAWRAVTDEIKDKYNLWLEHSQKMYSTSLCCIIERLKSEDLELEYEILNNEYSQEYLSLFFRDKEGIIGSPIQSYFVYKNNVCTVDWLYDIFLLLLLFIANKSECENTISKTIKTIKKLEKLYYK